MENNYIYYYLQVLSNIEQSRSRSPATFSIGSSDTGASSNLKAGSSSGIVAPSSAVNGPSSCTGALSSDVPSSCTSSSDVPSSSTLSLAEPRDRYTWQDRVRDDAQPSTAAHDTSDDGYAYHTVSASDT